MAARSWVSLNEISLQYQPRIDLASGLVMRVEALLRWGTRASVRMWSEFSTERGFPPLLALELTESTFVDDFGQARQTFVHLQAKGISIAIDDFGIGQSRLPHLHSCRFRD